MGEHSCRIVNNRVVLQRKIENTIPGRVSYEFSVAVYNPGLYLEGRLPQGFPPCMNV